MDFEYLKTNENIEIKGPLLISPKKFKDSRGFFYESWNEEAFNKITNSKIKFVQDNHSKSKKGVLRGLHYQIKPYAQGKLVRCINGNIFDVIVDIRVESETFGKWVGITLSESNFKELWVPEGFAHGFLTISETAEVIYKTTNFWNKESERSILWNDKKISINWPLKLLNNEIPFLSNKDMNASNLEKAKIYKELF